MRIIKKIYPFLLGLYVLVILNSYPILREAPSVGMLGMFIIGCFKLTKFHED